MDATWRENNIDIEKIQSFVTTRLNKSRRPNLLFNQLFDSYITMQYKILTCYIFDDFDTLYVEADDGKGILNVIFNSLLTTKLKYRMSIRKIEIKKLLMQICMYSSLYPNQKSPKLS